MTVKFSNNSLYTINDFAIRMGMTALPEGQGAFIFVFERSGELTFMPSLDGSRLILSLSRSPLHKDAQREKRALQLGGPDLATNLMLHSGITPQGALVFSFMLEEHEIEISKVESCVDRLIELHDQL